MASPWPAALLPAAAITGLSGCSPDSPCVSLLYTCYQPQRKEAFPLQPAKFPDAPGLAAPYLWTPCNGRNIPVKILTQPSLSVPSSPLWFFLPLSVPSSPVPAQLTVGQLGNRNEDWAAELAAGQSPGCLPWDVGTWGK